MLDRSGHVARALALPTYQDGITPFAVQFPAPRATDDRGRVIAESGYHVIAGVVAESTLIVRADLDSRQVDVVGASHASKGRNRNDSARERQPCGHHDSSAHAH